MDEYHRVASGFTRIVAALLLFAAGSSYAGGSLRFYGNGVDDIDRVKIRIDDPANTLPGPPADIGATDFTIEFWLRGSLAENIAGPVSCGPNINWINGNIVLDRDRYNQDRKFGVSLAAGEVVFGVSGDGTGDQTICSGVFVLDSQWHHVVVDRRRSDGRMRLYVDGVLRASADGPDGDISYPDNGVPGDFCGGPCTNSDPFLVIAAEKHDAGSAYPSYSGLLDEMRLSSTLRYNGNFTPQQVPFNPDGSTAALYHFDEGTGVVLTDVSGAAGGPSNGELKVGGLPVGPSWSADTPFQSVGECCRAMGDFTHDGIVDGSDLGMIVDYVFFDLAPPFCPAEMDLDFSQAVDGSDLQILVEFIFDLGVPELPACA